MSPAAVGVMNKLYVVKCNVKVSAEKSMKESEVRQEIRLVNDDSLAHGDINSLTTQCAPFRPI